MGVFDQIFGQRGPSDGLSPYGPQAGSQVPGNVGGLRQGLRGNSNALLMAGLGMLGGQDDSDAFSGAMRGFGAGSAADMNRRLMMQQQQEREAAKGQKAAERNATIEYLRSTGNYTDAQLSAAQGSPGAMAGMLSQSFQAPKDTGTTTQKEYAQAVSQGFKGTILDYEKAKSMATTPGGGVYGAIPTGQMIQQTPDGPVLQDIPGSKAQVASEASKANSVAQAQEMLDVIKGVKEHKGRTGATGATSMLTAPFGYAVPGSATADFNARLEQLKGKAFLQAFETLKGGGQITEREGIAAQNAIARLQTSQSDGAFLEALNDLEIVVESALGRAGGDAPKSQSGWVTLPSGVKIRQK